MRVILTFGALFLSRKNSLRTFDPAFCAHFLVRSSKILNNILFLLVNLSFTMPIKLYSIKNNAIKVHIINIRCGLSFEAEGFFRRDLLIFSFDVKTVLLILIPIFPCRLHTQLFCFFNVSWWSQIICLINFYEIFGHILTNLFWIFWGKI